MTDVGLSPIIACLEKKGEEKKRIENKNEKIDAMVCVFCLNLLFCG